jgi:hypothetical protein
MNVRSQPYQNTSGKRRPIKKEATTGELCILLTMPLSWRTRNKLKGRLSFQGRGCDYNAISLRAPSGCLPGDLWRRVLQ